MRNNKGQSTLEYAILIAVIIGALIAMQKYMGRSFQGRIRSSADNIGEQYVAGKTITTSTVGKGVETTKETYGKAVGAGPGGDAIGETKFTVVLPGVETRSVSEDTNVRIDDETVYGE